MPRARWDKRLGDFAIGAGRANGSTEDRCLASGWCYDDIVGVFFAFENIESFVGVQGAEKCGEWKKCVRFHGV